jgi:pimeloyl-ACP methyl ester carboxylesterase
MHRVYSTFEFQKAQLHYSEYGKGSKVLLCFHGFGQSNEHFKVLEEVLRDEYKIYSFDLFYHGNSFWHEKDQPLSKEFWKTLMEKFIQEKKIPRFSVLGFSMGGKFALGTLEHFYDKTEKIILIAPDGVRTSFWYRIATDPQWTRGLMRRVIVKPDFYFNMVRFLHFFRIVDKGILRFANTQMKTRRQRRKVYYSWVVFRKLKFDMKEIATILNRHSIKLEMYLGEYDKIITQKNMKRLLNHLNDYSLNILPSGHSSLIEAVAKHLRNK